jgi:hypothetical protein
MGANHFRFGKSVLDVWLGEFEISRPYGPPLVLLLNGLLPYEVLAEDSRLAMRFVPGFFPYRRGIR